MLLWKSALCDVTKKDTDPKWFPCCIVNKVLDMPFLDNPIDNHECEVHKNVRICSEGFLRLRQNYLEDGAQKKNNLCLGGWLKRKSACWMFQHLPQKTRNDITKCLNVAFQIFCASSNRLWKRSRVAAKKAKSTRAPLWWRSACLLTGVCVWVSMCAGERFDNHRKISGE